MANYFNNYFVNVGEKLASSIPVVNEKISNIVHSQNPANSFFMSSSTEKEIDSLNRKKAIRKLDFKTKFLKFGKVLISDTIRKFFNNFIEEGVYPSCLKNC